MDVLNINTDMGESKLLLGEKLINLKNYLPEGQKLIVTDKNVYRLYQKQFPKNIPVVIIGLGEKAKTLVTLEKIYEACIKYELDRSSFIIGIGGGIVCDITGFAAATYMRGLGFGFVSTTLLSQVDASVGGKNGVNLKGYKNMIGVFSQPRFVICDFEMLATLPEDEYIAAYAEIIKHAAIKNIEMFKYLEENCEKALCHNIDVIRKMVYDSLVIKSTVVNMDEKETGMRKMLNFGHTVGHAIEKTTGMIHGNAVSIGMVAAARLSVDKGTLSSSDAKRLESLILKFGLPLSAKLDKNKIIDAMRKDKKRERDTISFVLLKGLGDVVFEKVPIDNLKKIVYDLC